MTTIDRRSLLQGAAATLAAGFASGRMALAQSGDALNWLILAPMTGPVAFTGKVEQEGWLDASDWINATGGIAGRKLNISIQDSEYKIDVGLAAWKRGIADGNVTFVKADGTGLMRAMAPENSERYKIFTGSSAASSGLADVATYPHFMLPASNYKDMMSVLLDHITNENPGKRPRVALVYSSTEFGRDPIEHTKAKIAAGNYELVLEEETPFTAVDVTPSAIKIRNAKPDYVLFHGYAANVWPELSRLAREYRVKAQFMVTSYACDPGILTTVGDSADGVIGVTPHTLNISGSEGDMLRVIEGYQKKRDPNFDGLGHIGYMFSWANAVIAKEVFTRVIGAGQELTGDNLIKALEGLKDWDSGGIFATPVTIRDHRVPSAILYRFSVKDSKVGLETLAKLEVQA